MVKSLPPVQMNGDTLEFNADAFHLDPNAVAEDLLRKLPGVTIWGDGSITVNGKQVSQVLVGGKPFFGGDTRIATQNIAKNAIDKIQVYQQKKDPINPLDSITEVNILLKKNKNSGNFGKVSAGYGTRGRYESDANINFFNPRSQLGFVSSSNNVNKIANDAVALLRNSTYKGVGASVDYQPDFSLQGVNQPNSGGVVFQHDFIPNSDYYHNNRLTGNYFLKNNTHTFNRKTKTITDLGEENRQIKELGSESKSSGTNQTLNSRYDKHVNNTTFYATTGLNMDINRKQITNQESTYRVAKDLQSTNYTRNDIRSENKRASFELGLTKQKGYYRQNLLPGNLDIRYSLNIGNYNRNELKQTDFNSFSDADQSLSFDRRYHNSRQETNQHLFLSLGDFSKWIFRYRGLFGISAYLKNNLDINTNNNNNFVENQDTVSEDYLIDTYLTNTNKLTIVNEQPALSLNKTFESRLTNRYNKVLAISFNAQEQFYHQTNRSEHTFQNMKKGYNHFVPNASISYNVHQFGDFEDSYTINFSRQYYYPTIDQLNPLVDSSNQYYIQQGNPLLNESYERKLSFIWTHISRRTKNTFNYSLNITGCIVDDSFSDSSITDDLGRSTHYTVNADGYKYMNISGHINKAYKFNNNQFQINFSPSLNIIRRPTSINGVWNISNITSFNNGLRLYYNYNDWCAINLNENYAIYQSIQNGIKNSKFKNKIQSTALSLSVNLTKRLTTNTNISYNHSTSTGSNNINYTIWNANATYRFLHGNNLELEFSALDLLHQNTSIINYGNNNMITQGTVNVLKQYFMFSIAYFPRKFGKNESRD